MGASVDRAFRIIALARDGPDGARTVNALRTVSALRTVDAVRTVDTVRLRASELIRYLRAASEPIRPFRASGLTRHLGAPKLARHLRVSEPIQHLR
jgi:hypothetical protein